MSVIDTLKKVIKDWDAFEFLLVIVFFPWSFAYIGFRMLQEWED